MAGQTVSWLVVLVGLSLVLPVAASAHLGLGTEDEPELWGDGKVTYDPNSPGAKDHDYLAINRSWFDADEDQQTITTHIRVLSTEKVEANLAQWSVQCGFNATIMAAGTETARVNWQFVYYDAPSGKIRENFSSIDEKGSTANGNSLPAVFSATKGTPGYYSWTIKKAPLLKYGTNLTNLAGSCAELFLVAGVPTTISNRAVAASKSDFSLIEDRRVAGPDGQPDDIPSLAGKLPPVKTSSSEEAPNKSPFAGMVLVLATLSGVAWLRRRQ